MNQAKISVHVEKEHTCGHTHKTIFHMKDANLEGHANAYYHDWKLARNLNEIGVEHTLALSGNVERVELNMCGCSFGLEKVNWMKKLYCQFKNWIRK